MVDLTILELPFQIRGFHIESTNTARRCGIGLPRMPVGRALAIHEIVSVLIVNIGTQRLFEEEWS